MYPAHTFAEYASVPQHPHHRHHYHGDAAHSQILLPSLSSSSISSAYGTSPATILPNLGSTTPPKFDVSRPVLPERSDYLTSHKQDFLMFHPPTFGNSHSTAPTVMNHILPPVTTVTTLPPLSSLLSLDKKSSESSSLLNRSPSPTYFTSIPSLPARSNSGLSSCSSSNYTSLGSGFNEHSITLAQSTTATTATIATATTRTTPTHLPTPMSSTVHSATQSLSPQPVKLKTEPSSQLPRSPSTTTKTIDESKSLENKQIRKYQCKTCIKSFTTSGHLARHARIHTGERKHQCPFPGCASRFARQDNCMQHFRTHQNKGKRRGKRFITTGLIHGTDI